MLLAIFAAMSALLAPLASGATTLKQAPRSYVIDKNGIERYFGLVMPSDEDLRKMNLIEIAYDLGRDSNLSPSLVDYSSYMLPVKDQSKCGSCWIFSSVSVIEGLINRAAEAVYAPPLHAPLSTGELLDCCLIPVIAQRCDGGEPMAVFAYVQSVGVCPASSYAYHIGFELCQSHACDKSVRTYIRAYGLIRPKTHYDLAVALKVHGPLVVGLDAWNLHSYSSGLFSNCTVNPEVNHAVALVGLVEKDGQLAWKIQNSWGTDFGEDGFFYMPYDETNDCGLMSLVTFGVV